MHTAGQRVLVDLDERPVAARYFGRGQINADPSRCNLSDLLDHTVAHPS